MKINHKERKIFFNEKNMESSRNIMNEKPQSELGEKTSEIFYSGFKTFLIQKLFNKNKH